MSELTSAWLVAILVLAVLRGILYVKQERVLAAERQARAQERAERAAAKAAKVARPRKTLAGAPTTGAPATDPAGAATAAAAANAAAPVAVGDATVGDAPAAAADNDLPVREESVEQVTHFSAPRPPSREDFIAAGRIIPAGAWE